METSQSEPNVRDDELRSVTVASWLADPEISARLKHIRNLAATIPERTPPEKATERPIEDVETKYL